MHLVGQAMPLPQREQRPDIGPREFRRMRIAAERADRIEPPGAPGQQEAVLEQIPLRQLQEAQRQRHDRRIEAPRLEMHDQVLAGGFQHVELDPRRGGLQELQQPRQQIGRERRQDADREPERAVLETLAHGFQQQRLVEDPEGLFMGFPAQAGELDAAALALHQRPAEPGFQLADLQRQRGLRDVDALGRAAERAVFDQGLEIA